jgi:hypothetical protein
MKVVKLEKIDNKQVINIQKRLMKACKILHENLVLNVSTRVTKCECKILSYHHPGHLPLSKRILDKNTPITI